MFSNGTKLMEKSNLSSVLTVAVLIFFLGCSRHAEDEANWILSHPDKASVPQNEKGTYYPTHTGNAFKGMDSHVQDAYGHEFTKDEIKGRNTWVMWSGGNQEFWDYVARNSNGIVDLLRLCDSRFVSRKDRFRIMGLVPHPGMEETNPAIAAGKPSRSNNWGLHLDKYNTYSGEYGAYVEGERPDPKVYGYASGIVGLRLFPRAEDPDPRIRKEWELNRHKWDPDRYIYDESYYKNPELIRPFRIGMSCSFCHVSPNPMNPPLDMAKPYWKNLSSNIGAQYFWFGRIFGADLKRDNALHALLNYAEPGTLDTSLVATDGNNNPNTMNSVYQLLPRIIVSLESPAERQSKDTLAHMPRLDQGYDFDAKKIVNDWIEGPNDTRPLRFNKEEQEFLYYLGLPPNKNENGGDSPRDRLPALGDDTTRHTPKVLAGGADSIGGRGALCRVYLNIGEYSTEWQKLSNIMVGITPQKPFKMQRASENSLNWHVTMRRSTNVAKYFLANSVPMRMEDAIDLQIQRNNDEKEKLKHQYGENHTAYKQFVEQAANFESTYKLGSEHGVKPNTDGQVLLGAKVFARDCFVCHSSLGQPEGFWKDAANWKKWVLHNDNEGTYVEKAEAFITQYLNENAKPHGSNGKNIKLWKDDPFFEKFVKKNYLSTDARYPVAEIGTNTARSIADNGGRLDKDEDDAPLRKQRMWNDFSSIDFKQQERRPDTISIADPYKKDSTREWTLNTEAGPGRYRPPSLSSMWAHAPYLHNNSVGYYPYDYRPDPRAGLEGESIATFVDGIQSIESRIKIFEDSSRRLLGLPSEPDYNAAKYRRFSSEPRRLHDSIVRFEKDSSLVLPATVVPNLVEMQSLALLGFGIPYWVQVLILIVTFLIGIWLLVKGVNRARQGKGLMLRNVAALLVGLVLIIGVFYLWQKKEYRIGHIPKGTPVNLIVNLNGPEWATGTPERKKLLWHALVGLQKAKKHKVRTLEDERLTVDGRPLVDILIELSKCPDLVLDRGHDFGIYETPGLANGNKIPVSVEEREALIEFLKKL